jgi:hypothetical protein
LPPNKPSTLYIMQGETNDFSESFAAYLRTDEYIDVLEVTSDTGLTVVSSAVLDGVVTYRLTAPVELDAGIWQQVKIKVTTTEGRVEIRVIDFQVKPAVNVGNQGA